MTARYIIKLEILDMEDDQRQPSGGRAPMLYASTPYDGDPRSRAKVGIQVAELLDAMLLNRWADVAYPPKEGP